MRHYTKYIYISLLCFLFFVASLPVENDPSQSSPAFVPDPPGRGTLGLLTSCVSTLVLCVWTAIHMNIPPAKMSVCKRIWEKFRWAVVTMVAPEVTLLRAMMQCETARKLRDERNAIWKNFNSALHDTPEGSWAFRARRTKEQTKSQSWTLDHGFFAMMGGYVISVEENNSWILDDGPTVTPRGVLELASLGLLPEIDIDTIRGRSQTDRLAKAVVIIQVSWMLIQIMGRTVSNLPITLLELNTLAHVLVALILYVIWWNKPKDVVETVEIRLDALIASYMSSRSLRSCFVPASSLHSNNIRQTQTEERRTRAWQRLAPPNRSGREVIGTIEHVFPRHGDLLLLPDERDRNEIKSRLKPRGLVMLFPGQSLEGLPVTPSAGPQHLTDRDIERLVLYTKLLNHSGPHNSGYELKPFASDARLCRKAAQGRIQGNLQTFSENKTLRAISLLGLVYGAIHATSWDGNFPTYIERTLWRAASCVVIGGGLFICFLDYLLRHYTRTNLWPLGKGCPLPGRTSRQRTVARFLLAAINVVAAACTLSRSFFVAEAFISIRRLPLGSYDTVDWINLLPHVT